MVITHNRWGFYEGTAADEFTSIKFDFSSNAIKIVVDSGTLEFSWDGSSLDGKVKATDGPVDFWGRQASRIWLKGGATYRIFAWVNYET